MCAAENELLARMHDGTRKHGFIALLHHVDPARLRAAYWVIYPSAAPVVDGLTGAAYGQDLQANLQDMISPTNRRLGTRDSPDLPDTPAVQTRSWTCALTLARAVDRPCRPGPTGRMRGVLRG